MRLILCLLFSSSCVAFGAIMEERLTAVEHGLCDELSKLCQSGPGTNLVIDPGPIAGSATSEGLTTHAVKNDADNWGYVVNTQESLHGDQTYIVRLKTLDRIPGPPVFVSGFKKGAGSSFGFYYTRYVWQFYHRSGYNGLTLGTKYSIDKKPTPNTNYLLVYTLEGAKHTISVHNLSNGKVVSAEKLEDVSSLSMRALPLHAQGSSVDVSWLKRWNRALSSDELSTILLSEGGAPVDEPPVDEPPVDEPPVDEPPVGVLRDAVDDNEMITSILASAPAQHPTEARFKRIGGSNIDVLTGKDEFPYCSDIGCYKSHNAFIDWTGGAWNFNDWEMAQPAGGGHADYGGNEVYLAELKLDESDGLAVYWSRPIDPQPLQHGSCGAPVTGPVSSHTYATPVYVEAQDEYWHATTGGWPATAACNKPETSKKPGKGMWIHDTEKWTKLNGEQTAYGRACYHRNANKIYLWQQVNGADFYTIDPAKGYEFKKVDNAWWLSSIDGFDTAMDQKRDICYWDNNGVGITGTHFDPATGKASNVFKSAEKSVFIGAMSVEHSTGNLVILRGGSVKHLDVKSNVIIDVSPTDGDIMKETTRTSRNIYGKFEMIEKIPCTGIGMIDPREGVYLMTLPESVCGMESENPVTGAPFQPMTLDEIKAANLVPEYEDLGRTGRVKSTVNLTGAGGERPEIGLLMEYHAEYIATGNEAIKDKFIELARGDEPWDDYGEMKRLHGLEFAHTPDLFYLPYLLTGDAEMLRRMELIDQHYRTYRKFKPEQAIKGLSGREFAWQLRNLFRLAYFQQQGLTTKNHYINSLNATRDYLLRTVSNPNAPTEEFRVINWNTVYSGSYGFTGWMQSFIGQVINHGVQMGFNDWLPIAEFHFEHLVRRCGDKWPLKGCDSDHVFFANYMNGDKNWTTVKAFAQTATWETIAPYPSWKTSNPEWINQPDNLLLPSGTGFTYANRAQYAYGWAALAAKNGIAGARALSEKLKAAITQRGDRWDYKNAVN